MPPGTTAKVENIPCVACFQVISELVDSWKRRGQLLPSSLLPCQFPRVRARAHTSTSLPDLEDPFDFFSNPFEELVHEGRPFYSESSPSLSVHSTCDLFETEFILEVRRVLGKIDYGTIGSNVLSLVALDVLLFLVEFLSMVKGHKGGSDDPYCPYAVELVSVEEALRLDCSRLGASPLPVGFYAMTNSLCYLTRDS